MFQIISWVTKLENQLYPVITTNATKPKDVADHIENKLSSVLPEIRRAQAEVNQKLKETEKLVQQTSEESSAVTHVQSRLQDLNQKLQDAASDYQVLSQVLIGYFRNLEEIDKKAELYNAEIEKTGYPKDVSSIDRILQEHEAHKQTIGERLRFAQAECDQISERIRKQVKYKHFLKIKNTTMDQ